MDAHCANASRRLVKKEIYGKVEYFIVHASVNFKSVALHN